MTDTVAVALIAVSGTIGSGFLSYLAARRSTEVQLRAIGAEMHRLQETHAEEHRRERQAAYFALIAEMEQIRQLAYGLLGPVTIERFRELNSELGKAYTQVLFLGEESVIDPLEKMAVTFAQLTDLVLEADQALPFDKRLQDAFVETLGTWNEREAQLISAMKTDIKNARREEAKAQRST
jgi:hypothetical protein